MCCRLVMIFFWIIIVNSFIGRVATPVADDKFQKISSKFENPRAIEIKNLPNAADGIPISTEEPFLSRDGRFLFFNTGEKEDNKNLHFAELIRGRWMYGGEVGSNINTKKEVEANPSMDVNYNFYYLDTGVDGMIRKARFDVETGELFSLKSFDVIPTREVKLFSQKFHGNIGVEVSADGTIVFFSRAIWNLKGFSLGKLNSSNIFFVRKKEGSYVWDEAEAKRIMRNINTSDLEYAASISSDSLELFFTRLLLADYKTDKVRSKIMHSRRISLSEPFGKPKMIEAIGSFDFVEGPAISGDGKELYYHKHNGEKFRIYKVTRQN